ncbi:MAG: GNAT family N-acetyltransferase [Rhodobacter sp.]|nr:GNAT family N-acetyltransferase [Rhodobacter sp.]
MSIRDARATDIEALGRIAETAGLFPAEYLADMIRPALEGAADIWLVAEIDGVPAGFAFARPEEMTDRVWNLLALGVAPATQGKGLAGRLVAAIEARLDARMIIVETTQLPEQAAARALYAKAGYEEEGRVRDFYSEGEDKVIFRKVLS